MKRYMTLALAAAFGMMLGFSAQASEAVSVTDMTGHEVKLEEPVTRIVALTASECEIVYALGAGDLIVGRGEYCDYPAEVLEVEAVSSGADTNIEQIIALEPQLVLMTTMAQSEEQVAALEEAGIAVCSTNAEDIEGVYEAITLIGKVIGREEEAAQVVEDMQDTFSELAELAAEDEKTRSVYFEVSPLEYGLWTAGKGTFMDEIAGMFGVENIFGDVDGWAEISEEQVIERNPDYIVTITMYFGEGPTPEEEICGRTGWEEITAVKEGHILNLQNNELSRPVPRLTEGAEHFYNFVFNNESKSESEAA